MRHFYLIFCLLFVLFFYFILYLILKKLFMKKKKILKLTNKKQKLFKFNFIAPNKIVLYTLINPVESKAALIRKKFNFNLVKIVTTNFSSKYKLKGFVFRKLSSFVSLFFTFLIFDSFLSLNDFLKKQNYYINLFFSYNGHSYLANNLLINYSIENFNLYFFYKKNIENIFSLFFLKYFLFFFNYCCYLFVYLYNYTRNG